MGAASPEAEPPETSPPHHPRLQGQKCDEPKKGTGKKLDKNERVLHDVFLPFSWFIANTYRVLALRTSAMTRPRKASKTASDATTERANTMRKQHEPPMTKGCPNPSAAIVSRSHTPDVDPDAEPPIQFVDRSRSGTS
eukprot:3288757-Amphidinium_carterae.1